MSNLKGNDRFFTMSAEVDVEVDADEAVEFASDKAIIEEYKERFSNIDNNEQLIIKLVQENDKRTALYELEKLLNVYSDWVNYA